MSIPPILGPGHAFAVTPLLPTTAAAIPRAIRLGAFAPAATMAPAAPTPTCWDNFVSAICYLPNLVIATIVKIVQFVSSIFTPHPARLLAELPPLTVAHRVQIQRVLTLTLNAGGVHDDVTRRNALAGFALMTAHPLQILSHIYSDMASPLPSDQKFSSAFAKIRAAAQHGDVHATNFINTLVAHFYATPNAGDFARDFAANTTTLYATERAVRANVWTDLLTHLAGLINTTDYTAVAPTPAQTGTFDTLLIDIREGRAVDVAAVHTGLGNAHPFHFLAYVYASRGHSIRLEAIFADHTQKERLMDVMIPLFERAKTAGDLYRFVSLYDLYSTLTTRSINNAVNPHDWEEIVGGAVNHVHVAAAALAPIPPAAPPVIAAPAPVARPPAAVPPAAAPVDIWGALLAGFLDALADLGAVPARPAAAAPRSPAPAPLPVLSAAEVTTTFTAMITAAQGWFDPAMRMDRDGVVVFQCLLEKYYVTLNPREKAALIAKMGTLNDGDIRNLLARITVNSLLRATSPLEAGNLPPFLRPQRDELERLRLKTDRTSAEINPLVLGLGRNANAHTAVKEASYNFVFDVMCESAKTWSDPAPRIEYDGAGFYRDLLDRYYRTLTPIQKAVLIEKIAESDPGAFTLLPRLAVLSLISSDTPLTRDISPSFLGSYIRDPSGRYADLYDAFETLRVRNHQPGAARDAGIPAEIDRLVGYLTQGNADSDRAAQATLANFAAAHPTT